MSRCQGFDDPLDLDAPPCDQPTEPGRAYCRRHLGLDDGQGEQLPEEHWNAILDDDQVGQGSDDQVPTLADRIRSRLVTTKQLRDMPPPTPMVHGWLNLDSLAMMYGPSGAGKSFVAIDLAMTVQSGLRWWHGNEVTPGDVLYIVAEGTPGATLRTTAWEEHHGRSSEVTWHPGAVSIFEPAWASAIAEIVTERRPSLVIIDTFARSIVGADENSTRDMGLAIEHLDMIRRAAGSCVLVVHHAGKDVAKGARGASALKGAMDTEIEVVGTEDRVTVRNSKQKDGPEAGTLHFRLRGVPDTGSVVLEQAGSRLDDADDLHDAALATLEALSEIDTPEGTSSTAWRVATEVAERTFYRHKAELVRHGLVRNIGTDARPRYRPSGLSEEGVEQ